MVKSFFEYQFTPASGYLFVRSFRVVDVAGLLPVGHLYGEGSEYLSNYAYTVAARRLLSV